MIFTLIRRLVIRFNEFSLIFSETQAKDIQERINRVEKHFGDLCSSFAAYARKGGRLRDKGY